MKIRTADDVRTELESQGVSITQWAIANKFSPQLVYNILAGKRQCTRGQSHNIAVKLGMKAGKICSTPADALAQTQQRTVATGM